MGIFKGNYGVTSSKRQGARVGCVFLRSGGEVSRRDGRSRCYWYKNQYASQVAKWEGSQFPAR